MLCITVETGACAGLLMFSPSLNESDAASCQGYSISFSTAHSVLPLHTSPKESAVHLKEQYIKHSVIVYSLASCLEHERRIFMQLFLYDRFIVSDQVCQAPKKLNKHYERTIKFSEVL